MSGYPKIRHVVSKYISEPICKVTAFKDTVVTTNCFPRGGVSGGPLFYYDKKAKKHFIVATLTAQVVDNARQIFGSTWSTLYNAEILRTENAEDKVKNDIQSLIKGVLFKQ